MRSDAIMWASGCLLHGRTHRVWSSDQTMARGRNALLSMQKEARPIGYSSRHALPEGGKKRTPPTRRVAAWSGAGASGLCQPTQHALPGSGRRSDCRRPVAGTRAPGLRVVSRSFSRSDEERTLSQNGGAESRLARTCCGLSGHIA